MNLARIFKHLAMPDWMVRRAFPPRIGEIVAAAVVQAEKAHDVELRVVAEGGLPMQALLAGQSARERAIDVFAQQRVWDTQNNTGILIYVQVADRAIEIVADRGISARVSQAEWDAVCVRIAAEFRQGRYEDGVRAGIDGILALLRRRVPPPLPGDRDELPDQPTVI
jgi:uncharacterized membrane protein